MLDRITAIWQMVHNKAFYKIICVLHSGENTSISTHHRHHYKILQQTTITLLPETTITRIEKFKSKSPSEHSFFKPQSPWMNSTYSSNNHAQRILRFQVTINILQQLVLAVESHNILQQLVLAVGPQDILQQLILAVGPQGILQQLVLAVESHDIIQQLVLAFKWSYIL